MGFFSWVRRLFKIGEAEIHAGLDKLEDPSKMAEQGIRDLKKSLTSSIRELAEVKSLHIQNRRELDMNIKRVSEYENKAIMLLQRAQNGEMDQKYADSLAQQALQRKDEIAKQVQSLQKNHGNYSSMVGKIEGHVNDLRSQISTWEREVKTLKARQKVSEVAARINKEKSRIDL